MPLVQERTNYRLDKILTMYDASLGTKWVGCALFGEGNCRYRNARGTCNWVGRSRGRAERSR